MKTSYEIEIAGVSRKLSLFPINDAMKIAGFIMFGDTEITVASAKELLKIAPDFDVIITAESKGIPLAYEMARQSGKDYIVARKGAKLYMSDVITVEVDSITTDNKQILCLGHAEKELMNGRRILVVDDVVSTGESLNALITLVHEVGGNVVGKMAVLAEGDAIGRPDITYLAPLPLFDSEGNPIA